MLKVRLSAILLLLLAVAVAVAACKVPVPADWQYSVALFYWPFALTAALAVTHSGGAILLLMGSDAYKAELRKAYLIICVSIIAGALGTAQLPVFNAFSLWGTFWAATGLYALPFVLAGLGAYLGVRKIAKLIGLQHPLTRISTTIPAILLVCFSTALLPHVHTPTDELTLDVSNMIVSWSVLTFLSCVIIMYGVIRLIGAHYFKAMAWLFAGFAGSCSALTVSLVGAYASSVNPDGWAVASYAVGVVAGLFYITAGVAFNKTKEF